MTQLLGLGLKFTEDTAVWGFVLIISLPQAVLGSKCGSN